ncbi:MAG: flagellar biosynthetic protein FliO [Acidobacteriota bacterium]
MDASQEAWLLLRGFAALLVVIVIAFITLRFGLPWLMRYRAASRPRTLQVDEFLPLDRNHRLYVVRWDRTHLLIATSPDRVQVLHTRADPGSASFEHTLEEVGRASNQGADKA